MKTSLETIKENARKHGCYGQGWVRLSDLEAFEAELRQRMLEQMNDLGTVHQDGSITFRHMKVPKISIREILGEEGDVK